MKVLIVGGYGVFGGRLARLLEAEGGMEVVVAGRSLERATAFCADHGGEAAAFDRDGDLTAQLKQLAPQVVVDASGPFQAYGYGLAQACVDAGISYLDLADSGEFVDGIVALDGAARQAGVFVLSGLSTCPALTEAVVRDLAEGMTAVRAIEAGIAPSPSVRVGRSVVDAIAGYAGKPIAGLRRRRGRGRGYALIESRRRVIAPPGRVPLRPTRFSLVDVPDLRVLPRLWPEIEEVWVGAGLRPAILHRLLTALAWLVRLRLLPSLKMFAGLFEIVSNACRWGEARGGMYVRIVGLVGGAGVERSWHLIAEGDEGPFVPAMAAAALLLRIKRRRGRPAPGARVGVRELSLADFEPLFAARGIAVGKREITPATLGLPLYRRVLGEASTRLAPSIRTLHDLSGLARFSGRARVERGTGLLARIAGAVIGFPKAAEDTSVTVEFTPSPKGELWRRTFEGRSFTSFQTEGKGRCLGLIPERFGPLNFGLAVVVEDGGIKLVLRRWTAFGIPLPLWLGPNTLAGEFEDDKGRFNFHVEIGHPLTGLIVRYQGWLEPDAATD